jgi:hypothetical protein
MLQYRIPLCCRSAHVNRDEWPAIRLASRPALLPIPRKSGNHNTTRDFASVGARIQKGRLRDRSMTLHFDLAAGASLDIIEPSAASVFFLSCGSSLSASVLRVGKRNGSCRANSFWTTAGWS